MAYKPIASYGIIGDMNSAALVGMDGSIDWCCFPRFDSPSVFAAILDDKKGGRFQIAPAAPGWESHQAYLPNTNILRTEFMTPSGKLSVTDFMPLRNGHTSAERPREIHRIARCEAGSVQARCVFQPRPDYARAPAALAKTSGGVTARGEHQTFTLCSRVPLEIGDDGATAQFTLGQGDEAVFVLAYGHQRPTRVESYRTDFKLAHAKSYWESVAASITYNGLWKEHVTRSCLALQLMIYEPSGAIVAAPTASLPETIGGSRNWDYRFSWLRDSSFTMEALYRMGLTKEASRYIRWLTHQCKVTNGRTRIVYGVTPSSSLKEITLDHLEGSPGQARCVSATARRATFS